MYEQTVKRTETTESVGAGVRRRERRGETKERGERKVDIGGRERKEIGEETETGRDGERGRVVEERGVIWRPEVGGRGRWRRQRGRREGVKERDEKQERYEMWQIEG